MRIPEQVAVLEIYNPVRPADNALPGHIPDLFPRGGAGALAPIITEIENLRNHP